VEDEAVPFSSDLTGNSHSVVNLLDESHHSSADATPTWSTGIWALGLHARAIALRPRHRKEADIARKLSTSLPSAPRPLAVGDNTVWWAMTRMLQWKMKQCHSVMTYLMKATIPQQPPQSRLHSPSQVHRGALQLCQNLMRDGQGIVYPRKSKPLASGGCRPAVSEPG